MWRLGREGWLERMCPFICKHLGATSGQLCKPSPAECNLSLGQVEGRAGPGCFILTQVERTRQEGGRWGKRVVAHSSIKKNRKGNWFGFGPQVTFTLGKLPKVLNQARFHFPPCVFRTSPGSLSETLVFRRLVRGFGLRDDTRGT